MSAEKPPRLHQVVEAVLPGDATSDHVRLLQGWLTEFGVHSDVYSAQVKDGHAAHVKPFAARALAGEPLVIFHHTMGSDVLDQLAATGVPLLLIYHNITPPQFFSSVDPDLARQLQRGRQQLEMIRPLTRLALSDSAYSERELRELGFQHTGVLPIVLDESRYQLPPDEALLQQCRSGGPLLLFVGRLAPNKRQEDLLKLLHAYRRLRPDARLVLVGGQAERAYVAWLKDFAARLGLAEAVTFSGHVTQQEMLTYYRGADLFISMSEHEGFGKPLIESMYLDLPVLAYAAAAVPDTLGGAGVLFNHKNYEALAELVDMLVHDQKLRRQLLAGQRRRLQVFLAPQVRAQWREYLVGLGVLPAAIAQSEHLEHRDGQ